MCAANKGIGFEIARILHEAGLKVVVTSRNGGGQMTVQLLLLCQYEPRATWSSSPAAAAHALVIKC